MNPEDEVLDPYAGENLDNEAYAYGFDVEIADFSYDPYTGCGYEDC